MITLCWAAKGGSGTTVVTAVLALRSPRPALLVDLDGELPCALALPSHDRPGVWDWFESDAPADHLDDLLVEAQPGTQMLCHRAEPAARPSALPEERLDELGRWLRRWCEHTRGDVVVDGGTGRPPGGLTGLADRNLLVTRNCYLALMRAHHLHTSIDGVVLIHEHWRSLDERNVELSLGVPVVAKVEFDPAIGRAIDSGLLISRIPGSLARPLERVAG